MNKTDDKSKPLYLPGLNGIRAIAAVGVMLSHINLALRGMSINNVSLFSSEDGTPIAWNLGEQGVTMFFALSGFLITYLLLNERDKIGTIKQKSFYIRRVLRIWPLYFLYFLLAVLVVYFLSNSLPSVKQTFYYLLLMANVPFIINFAVPGCHHLWSIAVEEQFYLFWPFFFRKKLPLISILITLIIIQVVVRLYLWTVAPFSVLALFSAANRFDCMMIGGLFAILLYENNGIIRYILNPITQFLAWGVILLHVVNFEIVNSIVSMEFITVATAIIICGQISGKRKIINLEYPLFNFIGKYSYGIYVYHPLLIFIFSYWSVFTIVPGDWAQLFVAYLVIIALTITISFLSYEYLEKRFLRLKGRFSVVHSTNSQ